MMALFKALLFILPYLKYGVQSLDPWTEAHVDADLQKFDQFEQSDFTEIWQRELLALTALSRVQDVNLLSLETRNEASAWKGFRCNGIYEALLNMARLSDFQVQLQSQTKRTPLSLWGLEKSLLAYPDSEQYANYSVAAKGYPFAKAEESQWTQALSALVMAAKWANDLKKISFIEHPFYMISETVRAFIELRDPTSFFQGDQASGERHLLESVIYPNHQGCRREARIAIAFDYFGYNGYDLLRINQLLGEILKFTPHADITIRGTSKLKDGFGEGASLSLIPDMTLGPSSAGQRYEVLDLVNKSISDIVTSEESGGTLRARVIIIISKMKSRKPDIPRARALWDMMQRSSIEPYYLTMETRDVHYNDYDLMPLLNYESFRGISSGTDFHETVRAMLPRILRLICQSAVRIPRREWKNFTTFDKSAYNLYDRVHLRYDVPSHKGQSRFIAFTCVSAPPCPSDAYVHSLSSIVGSCVFAPVCKFDVYAHSRRLVNEYFHDTHERVVLPLETFQVFDLFSNSSDVAEMNFVVVPDTASTIAVQAYHYVTSESS